MPLALLNPHECPYLPGRVAQSRAFWADELPAELYVRFMDAGFRRSGKIVYQPTCARCRECVPIRVPVNAFRPSKSQRRCWKRNVDEVSVTFGLPAADDESFALYRRYLTDWHRRDDDDDDEKPKTDSREDFETFLYDSPVETMEFKYRDVTSGHLLAVGICDASATSLSSVYFFHDPSERRRGLGTFGALYEISFARERGLEHYYLGYHVRGCRAMQYKASFRPCEFLRTDGRWARQEPKLQDTNVGGGVAVPEKLANQ